MVPPASPSLIGSSLSYDTNVMLAAIISLLLVILFVLLLHLYARWFLLQHTPTVPLPHLLPPRFHRHRFTTTANSPPNSPLPLSLLASLPLFIYHNSSFGVLECAICLSLFEEDDIGRKLPQCGHPFHLDCIDMWFNSHSTCPICRASIQPNNTRHHNHILDIDVSINNGDDSNCENENYVVEIDLGGGFSSKNFVSSSTSRSGAKIHPSNLSAGEPEE